MRPIIMSVSVVLYQVAFLGSISHAASGTLNIHTEPSGASYYVLSIGEDLHADQIVHTGYTNYFNLSFPKGIYDICVEKAGYESILKRVYVRTYGSEGIYSNLRVTTYPQKECLAYLEQERLATQRKRYARPPIPIYFGPDGADDSGKPDKGDYNNAKLLDYRKATLGEYEEGTLLVFSGKVSQIVGNSRALIYPDGEKEPVLLSFDIKPQLIENDISNIKGRYVSPTKYTTVLGAEKVVPLPLCQHA